MVKERVGGVREPAEPSIDDTFHDRIQIARQSSRMAAREVAHELGVTEKAYRKWEARVGENIQKPPYSALVKMADLFGVSTDFLLCRTLSDVSDKNRTVLKGFAATKMQELRFNFDGHDVVPNLVVSHNEFFELMNSLYALWCKCVNTIYLRDYGHEFNSVDADKPYSVEKMIGRDLNLSDRQIIEFLLDNSCRLAREIFRDMARVDEAEKGMD